MPPVKKRPAGNVNMIKLQPPAPTKHKKSRKIPEQAPEEPQPPAEQPAAFAPPEPHISETEASWATLAATPAAHHPDWAVAFVQGLMAADVLQKGTAGPREITLRVWSDCGGLATEMFSAKELSTALENLCGITVKWILYCYCDQDARAHTFVKANHAPLHASTNMEQRNMRDGKYWCSLHQENHDLPKSGIDVYVAGYPCSPWSRRGLRTGFDHPDIKPFLIGMETIEYMKPAVWMMETVAGAGDVKAGQEKSGLQQVLEHVRKTVRTPYHSQLAQNVTPLFHGYPVRRPRFFLINVRIDACEARVLEDAARSVLANPLPVRHSYFDFLGLTRDVDWSRVDQLPEPAEQRLLDPSCKCSLDPTVACPIHKCGHSCGKCGPAGNGCTWRSKMKDFIASHNIDLLSSARSGKLTYVQVLELSRGHAAGPQNPRQRNMLNVYALLPRSYPLNDTLLLADLSQAVDRDGMRYDGTSPTLATNSQWWCFRAGMFLTVPHKAALQGFRIDQLKFPTSCTEPFFRERLGLGIHVASMGAMLLAAVAGPLNRLASMKQ